MTDTPVAADATPIAQPAAAPAAADTTPAAAPTPQATSAPAAPAETAKTPESAPSLLASADAGKRDGAPKTDADAKPAETPPPADAKAPETPDGKAPDAKPEDGKDKPKDGADAAVKDAPAETPPAPPVYEAPKLPEGVKLDDKALASVDKKLGDFQIANKLDQAVVQGLRQELINEYIADRTALGNDLLKYQHDVWNRTIEKRISEFRADPELGGSRAETTLGNAKYVLESWSGLTKPELDAMLKTWEAGGIQVDRLTIKALNNIYARFQPPQPVESNNPAASKIMSQPGKRSWYDTVDGAKSA